MANASLEIKSSVVEVKIKNTGYPMDGCRAICIIFDIDPDNYVLWMWERENDMIFAESMYKSEIDSGICASENFDEFMGKWNSGQWENEGSFCLRPDQVAVMKEWE